jgi:hypothetical protein
MALHCMKTLFTMPLKLQEVDEPLQLDMSELCLSDDFSQGNDGKHKLMRFSFYNYTALLTCPGRKKFHIYSWFITFQYTQSLFLSDLSVLGG